MVPKLLGTYLKKLLILIRMHSYTLGTQLPTYVNVTTID